MGRAKAAFPFIAIPEPEKFFTVMAPPAGFFPQFPGLHRRHEYLLSSCPIHFLTDNLFQFLDNSESYRQIRIDAACQFSYHSCPDHELMADNLRI
jgi:hypothetical protein